MGVVKDTLIIGLTILIGLPLISSGSIITYDLIRYKSYYDNAEKMFKIPGINDNYIPQGLAYSTYFDVFLNAGYMLDGSASRIYITNNDDSNETKYVSLKYNDELFTKHSGGITVHGEKAYISCDKNLYRISVSDLINASNGDYVNIENEQKVHTKANFCFATDTMIFVGENNDGNDSEINYNHHIKNDKEVENHSLILAYKISGNIVDATPLYGYSIPNRVQGMCITESEEIILSTANGISPSKLLTYKKNAGTYSLTYEKKDISVPVPITFLGENELTNEVKCPPMNKDIAYKNSYVYINNASASNRYIYGKITKAKYIYRIKIN